MKLALIVAVVLAAVVVGSRVLRRNGFSLKYTAGLSAPVENEQQYVERVLREFLAGDGGKRDWDDFTSCPLRTPALERIRTQAALVDLPLDHGGRAVLIDLLREADRVADDAQAYNNS